MLSEELRNIWSGSPWLCCWNDCTCPKKKKKKEKNWLFWRVELKDKVSEKYPLKQRSCWDTLGLWSCVFSPWFKLRKKTIKERHLLLCVCVTLVYGFDSFFFSTHLHCFELSYYIFGHNSTDYTLDSPLLPLLQLRAGDGSTAALIGTEIFFS